MRKHQTLGLSLVLLLAAACSSRFFRTDQSKDVLRTILYGNKSLSSSILRHPQKYRLQILYTRIDRDRANRPHFTSYQFRVNRRDYFYPASSVKLAAAVLALEKLNRLRIPGLDKWTPLLIDSAYAGQTAVRVDSLFQDGKPSIGRYIEKIFLVSDNDAFNRLYEFLGQQYLNETLWEKGYTDARIIRRLETGLSPEENRATNPFTFYRDGRVIYRQPLAINPNRYRVVMNEVKQGVGTYQNGRLIRQPIDFSYSNYMSVESLQNILKAVLFPEAVPEKMRFDLTEDDRRFLLTYLAMVPRESGIPAYRDTTRFPDNYVKFFMFGNSGEKSRPSIRIFSKSGLAYGYLIDNGYIVDFRRKVEFLLTAVLQVNKNRIYNDDQYEYDELGIPFLKNLGKAVYEYECSRQRQFPPDLSEFRFGWSRYGAKSIPPVE